MSNADILNAIKDLFSRFSSLKGNIKKNSEDIKENLEGMDHLMKSTVDKEQAENRQISEQEMKIEEAERYS